MLNVPELERRYARQKYKRYAVWILVIAVVIAGVISAGLIYFKYLNKTVYPAATKTKTATKTATKSVVKPATKPQQNLFDKISTNTTVKQVSQTALTTSKIKTVTQNTQVLQPSMQFMHNIQTDTKTNQSIKTKPAHIELTHKRAVIKPQVHHQIAASKPAVAIKVVTAPAIEQSSVTIKSVPISNNMQDIIKRFKRTNDPVLGLFLARRYYHLKKYTLAYNYALLTNQIDRTNEQSWIIFAKSLVKLGQKSMAIQTLKSYIKMSHSNRASVLLEDIQSGRFK